MDKRMTKQLPEQRDDTKKKRWTEFYFPLDSLRWHKDTSLHKTSRPSTPALYTQVSECESIHAGYNKDTLTPWNPGTWVHRKGAYEIKQKESVVGLQADPKFRYCDDRPPVLPHSYFRQDNSSDDASKPAPFTSNRNILNPIISALRFRSNLDLTRDGGDISESTSVNVKNRCLDWPLADSLGLAVTRIPPRNSHPQPKDNYLTSAKLATRLSRRQDGIVIIVDEKAMGCEKQESCEKAKISHDGKDYETEIGEDEEEENMNTNRNLKSKEKEKHETLKEGKTWRYAREGSELATEKVVSQNAGKFFSSIAFNDPSAVRSNPTLRDQCWKHRGSTTNILKRFASSALTASSEAKLRVPTNLMKETLTHTTPTMMCGLEIARERALDGEIWDRCDKDLLKFSTLPSRPLMVNANRRLSDRYSVTTSRQSQASLG
ncbi:unnamed protein product [Protopolystoma xenopodis]|uniref:Uncharacterized protein n=1 Tax=Protopolystoma xenopodis TaxID=117903 RepID=A0A3S4ZVR9_9PLAT|nr:unnamed protein product [Protopolystoma xenopodis]